MKINESWEYLKEETHANIENEKKGGGRIEAQDTFHLSRGTLGGYKRKR